MPQDDRIAFMWLGTLYAEALALLGSEAFEASMQHLEVLANVLNRIQAPQALSDYLNEVTRMVRSQQYPGKVAATFLALFEPLYEDAYGQGDETGASTFFQLSAWLENMYLAAAAGDASSLRRQTALASSWHHALRRLAAPQKVEGTFERLDQLIAQPEMTAADTRTIVQLVERMQNLLGVARQ